MSRRCEIAPIDRVLWALRTAGCVATCRDYQPDTWEAHCPAHEDRRPSLVIRRNPDGMVWLKCWAGCAKERILEALGLEWRDLFEGSERDRNALENAGRGLGGLPLHLRRAMEQLLSRDLTAP